MTTSQVATRRLVASVATSQVATRRLVASVARRPLALLAAMTIVVAVPAVIVLGSATAANAHPLGNFTVNHYHGLRVFPDRIEDSAVVDTAEIPALQEQARVDSDHDGQLSALERAAYAGAECAKLAKAIRGTVDGAPLRWRVSAATLDYRPGTAGLRTSRLACRLVVPARLSSPATVEFADGFRTDRIGWREITATGDGVRLTRASVPERSITGGLRRYPDDLLSSPLDQRSASLSTAPGSGMSPGAGPIISRVGLVGRALNALNGAFDDVAGSPRLTVPVGLLAVLLSIVLGASHAALPGHGKTVMAAYIAGRRGSVRDALVVGVIVTVTHTGGVLALGLALTLSTTVTGESLLGYLGLASGLLISAIGLGLLRSAWQAHRRALPGRHDLSPEAALDPVPAMAATALVPHGWDHMHPPGHLHGHPHTHPPLVSHGHGHGDGRADRSQSPFTGRGLVGLGVAGGLVPSPSALVVLLGAVALGRTWFGVALVLGYGLGMAALLTAAGLLVVRLRDRLDRLTATRTFGRAAALARLTPVLTAALVVVVGAGLIARELASLL